MRIEKATVDAWREKARVWLETGVKGGATVDDVKTGVDAWAVAHRVGITNEAYAMSRDIHDAHIQTALEKIFPNAVFKDAKRY